MAPSPPITIGRDSIEYQNAILKPINYNLDPIPSGFCGDKDLDEFFKDVANHYEKELLAKAYKLIYKTDPDRILALVSLMNDSFNLKNALKKRMPENKRIRMYPCLKVGRLGVRKEYASKGLGSYILNMIKLFFVTDNRTGCRYISVDAYNNPQVLNFYEKNGFQFNTMNDADPKVNNTRSMIFDLKLIKRPT